jgi:hypothetical protein
VSRFPYRSFFFLPRVTDPFCTIFRSWHCKTAASQITFFTAISYVTYHSRYWIKMTRQTPFLFCADMAVFPIETKRQTLGPIDPFHCCAWFMPLFHMPPAAEWPLITLIKPVSDRTAQRTRQMALNSFCTVYLLQVYRDLIRKCQCSAWNKLQRAVFFKYLEYCSEISFDLDMKSFKYICGWENVSGLQVS